MDTNFRKCMDIVFGHEGGLSVSKYDKGGATNYGISLNFLKGCGVDKEDLDKDGLTTDLIGDMNNDGKVDAADIVLLTREMCERLYYKYFWKKVNGPAIPYFGVALLLFDFAVNSGPETAAKKLQSALNDSWAAIAVDGDIGKHTIDAIRVREDKDICTKYLIQRYAFFNSIVAKSPEQRANYAGWINRLNHLAMTVGVKIRFTK